MPVYEIEQYELHSSKYRVQAISETEAVVKFFAGEGDPVDQSLEYIEVADDRGMPSEDFPKLAKALKARGIDVDEDIIPSIRSIDVV